MTQLPPPQQTSLFERLLTVVFGQVGTDLLENLSQASQRLNDFVYVRVSGLSFIVLGARQTGKTTLIEWMRQNVRQLANFTPEPTAPGGERVGVFNTQIGSETMRVKPGRDVGGEYEMWETDWTDLFRTARPRGIVFLLDHNDVLTHKDALNFVLNLIEEEPDARRNLRAFTILVNKSDVWSRTTTLEKLMNTYSNEIKRLNQQAARLGYRTQIHSTSITEGLGVGHALESFFDTIRPQPKGSV
jgi:hypothetical protein